MFESADYSSREIGVIPCDMFCWCDLMVYADDDEVLSLCEMMQEIL